MKLNYNQILQVCIFGENQAKNTGTDPEINQAGWLAKVSVCVFCEWHYYSSNLKFKDMNQK